MAEKKYVKITPVMIQDFLNRKAVAYNRERCLEKDERVIFSGTLDSDSWSTDSGSWLTTNVSATYLDGGVRSVRHYTSSETFEAHTKHYMNSWPGTIGKYKWVEDKIENLKTIPPMHVLQRLVAERAKNLFDYFTVARLEQLPDPLLLGRLTGVSDRFFICQWDNDICLDDLL